MMRDKKTKKTVGAVGSDHDKIVVRIIDLLPRKEGSHGLSFTIDPHPTLRCDPEKTQKEMVTELRLICAKWGRIMR